MHIKIRNLWCWTWACCPRLESWCKDLENWLHAEMCLPWRRLRARNVGKLATLLAIFVEETKSWHQMRQLSGLIFLYRVKVHELANHSVKISWFFYHSDFTWNQCWSFEAPQNCHFDHLSSSEFDFWEFLTFSSVKFFQNSKFKAKFVATPVFDLLKSSKIDFT